MPSPSSKKKSARRLPSRLRKSREPPTGKLKELRDAAIAAAQARAAQQAETCQDEMVEVEVEVESSAPPTPPPEPKKRRLEQDPAEAAPKKLPKSGTKAFQLPRRRHIKQKPPLTFILPHQYKGRRTPRLFLRSESAGKHWTRAEGGERSPRPQPSLYQRIGRRPSRMGSRGCSGTRLKTLSWR